MFGRAELQRTVVLVVALLLTAGSMTAFAREFRAADTQNEDYPTVQALRFMGRQINERTNGRHEVKVFHSRLLGESLPDGDPEIERTFDLFLKTHRELKQAKSTDLPYDCQGRFDREQWVNLPQGRIIDRDNYNTIRPWMAVMTYLLADYRFVHE